MRLVIGSALTQHWWYLCFWFWQLCVDSLRLAPICFELKSRIESLLLNFFEPEPNAQTKWLLYFPTVEWIYVDAVCIYFDSHLTSHRSSKITTIIVHLDNHHLMYRFTPPTIIISKYRYSINITVMSQRENNDHRNCASHWVPSHALANYCVSWFLISHLTLVSFKHCPEHTLGIYCHIAAAVFFFFECAPPSLYY